MALIILGIVLVIGLITGYAMRPKSLAHNALPDAAGKREKAIIALVVFVLIIACTWPMSVDPNWNDDPGRPYHKQFAEMAEAILDGRIYFDIEPSPELLAMENPYDTALREELGISYPWDHAFYNGRFYMYFGIVPVFLLFLPFLLITGTALPSYVATQIFVAFAIIGVFYLFRMLAKAFFKELSFGIYLLLSTTFSLISVCYAVAEPALYCTAISAALCLELWSLAFFVRAVWVEQEENRQILFAGLGAVLGALTFGCRPTIALANILVIPMLITFLRQKKLSFKLAGKLVLAALPYVVVAILLMVYNYVRFGSPFEFGQSYQLTITDQTAYASGGVRLDLVYTVKKFVSSFIKVNALTAAFPYVQPGGAFANFPILLLMFLICIPKVFLAIKEKKQLLFVITVCLLPVLITVYSLMWSPILLERYHMDIYFLMGIACYINTGIVYTCAADTGKQKKINYAVSALSVLSIGQVLLYLCSFDFVNYIV